MTVTTAEQRQIPVTARGFTVLNGLIVLGVLFQGVSAGSSMARFGPAWGHVHQISGMVTAVVALAAAVLAIATLRRRAVLVVQSIGLFVLLIAEIGLGEAMDDHHALVAAHVPVAILITVLSVYLTVASARLSSPAS